MLHDDNVSADSPRSQAVMSSAPQSPKHISSSPMAHAASHIKATVAAETSARHEIELNEENQFTKIQLNSIEAETIIRRAAREIELVAKRNRLEREAARDKWRTRILSLISQEKSEREAIELIAKDFRKSFRAEEQRTRLAKGVPRTSAVPRLLPPGSPVQLVHNVRQYEKRAAPPQQQPILLGNGKQLPPLKPLSSKTLSLLDSVEVESPEDASLVANSSTSLSTSLHPNRSINSLMLRSQELQLSRTPLKKGTSSKSPQDPTQHLLQLSPSKCAVNDESVTWAADQRLASSALSNTVALLQRVGRGFLLRNSLEVVKFLISESRPQNVTGLKTGSVSFVESDTFASFQTRTHASKAKGNLKSVSTPTGSTTRHHRLMSIYRLQHMDSTVLSEMLKSAEREHEERNAISQLESSGDFSASKSRLRRSPSTLFLEPRKNPSQRSPMSAQEALRLKLLLAEKAMKKQFEKLDKQTREKQAAQDVKMMHLARQEEESKERYRQVMGKLRERARVTRALERDVEHEQHRQALLDEAELRHEFEIKRALLHVEMRQKFMLEDRVTALRRTLTDLGNISHLSATVPSLNLTHAIKEMYLGAQGIAAERNRLCDP